MQEANSRARDIAWVVAKIEAGCPWRYEEWTGGAWSAEGWPLFELGMLLARILQGTLLCIPGSHEEEQEVWQSTISSKSDNEV